MRKSIRLRRTITLITLTTLVGGLFTYAFQNKMSYLDFVKAPILANDSSDNDSTKLKYPLKPKKEGYKNNLDLKDPENISETIKYNINTKRYDVYRTVGDKTTFTGKSYSLTEYLKLSEKSSYINLGEWLHYNTYAVFDGNKLELKAFEKELKVHN